MTNEFDDLRPYYDTEINEAMARIVEHGSFPLLASFVFPDTPLEEVKKRVKEYSTIKDFQLGVMYYANKRIIHNTMTNFTCNGLERLDPSKSYLFVSNHRDIMLDSSLLQNALVDHGFETSEITFGANLMMDQQVVDIGKSNKMFKVERPSGNPREFYRSSKHLSDYIRHTLVNVKHSAWIAQRNGRTKDGDDKTDQGIIKLFCMSCADNKIKAIADLNIVPVSVSYEWESCDVLKAIELYQSQNAKYQKKPGEDLNSILTGILQHKGDVHFEVCAPITREDLLPLSELCNNDYHRAVASLIDKRIINSYKLYPNNYVAFDMRYGMQRYSQYYTEEQKEAFASQLKKLEHYEECDLEKLTDIFLKIYSNPVKNRQ